MCADLIGLLSPCRHQFSWPRRDDAGENYQVCVHCGVTYSYDWAKMRRVAQLDNQQGELDASRVSMRKCGRKQAWRPRERRLRHCVSVLFRIPGSDEWIEGVTENISRSGILFRSPSPLEVGCSMELILEMPPELTGNEAALVVCEGSLVRVEPVPPPRKKEQPSFLMACTIAEYKFAPSSEQTIVAEQNVQ